MKALADNRRDATVADVMCRECGSVDAWQSLRPVVETMQGQQCSSLPVLRQGEIVGLLTLENISEMIMIRSAQRTGSTREVHA